MEKHGLEGSEKVELDVGKLVNGQLGRVRAQGKASVGS